MIDVPFATLLFNGHFIQNRATLYLLCHLPPDIDECNELSPCDETATCSNTDGSFLCTCNMGFIGNGINCTGEPLFLMIF